MNTFRLLPATAVVAVLSMGGVALAATAPVISKEHTLKATTAPLTIPGTGLKKDARLPSGDRLVYRTVTLSRGQKPTLTVRAPAGKTLRGLATSGKVGFTVVSPRSYVGHRSVKVRAFAPPKSSGSVSGRIYALVR
jgi:hypothetical protein